MFIITSLILFYKNDTFTKNQSAKLKNTEIEYDLLNPNFTMNNKKKQIKITANEGNFVNKNEILLKNKEVFKSDTFKILSNEVLFDKKKQTAKSKRNSTFLSKNTKIISEGFNISENGDKIIFNGKSTLILD